MVDEDSVEQSDRATSYLQAALVASEEHHQALKPSDVFVALQDLFDVDDAAECGFIAQMLCDLDDREPLEETDSSSQDVISAALDMAIRRPGSTTEPTLKQLIRRILLRTASSSARVSSELVKQRRFEIMRAIESLELIHDEEDDDHDLCQILRRLVSVGDMEQQTSTTMETPAAAPVIANDRNRDDAAAVDNGHGNRPLELFRRLLTRTGPPDSSTADFGDLGKGPALVILWQAMHESARQGAADTSSSSSDEMILSDSLSLLASDTAQVIAILVEASIEVLLATFAQNDEDSNRPWPEWTWTARGFGRWVQRWREKRPEAFSQGVDLATILDNVQGRVSEHISAIDARLEAWRISAQVDQQPHKTFWDILRAGLTSPPEAGPRPAVAISTWSDYSALSSQLGSNAANWTLRHDQSGWPALAENVAEVLSFGEISPDDAGLLASTSCVPLLEIVCDILGPQPLHRLVTDLLQKLADPENLVVSVLDDSQGPLTTFGHIVVLAHTLQRELGVPLPGEARSDRIFALSELTTDEQSCMSGWVQALFGVSGIGDDLLQATPPGRFLRLAPTLISQAINANEQGIIDAASLANGLSYFAQPLLSWSLICMMRSMADELGRETATSSTIISLGVIKTLLESGPPAVLEAVASSLVSTLAIAKKALPSDDFNQLDAIIQGHLKNKRVSDHKTWSLCAWIHSSRRADAVRYISTSSATLDVGTQALALSSRWQEGRQQALLVDVDVDTMPMERLQAALLATMVCDHESAKVFVARVAAASRSSSPQAQALLRWIVDEVGHA